ncbi:plasmid mobilization relaxosome protein MobC [Snodgrassella sp. B3088]|jgi:Bacterial mobilisation protein (MobC).|uniref:plasmid mobilization relaxosome protein MobC n=1 Tax=Snodgrassella sp. B3088 TaxID=2818038 RepID=UPI00226A54A0|nr:plasmid mobilization relaxosome protein MobC [Snodgrassella sp. B3088]
MSQPKIYGLTPEVVEKLKQIALSKTGKPSISKLAKTLLLEQLNLEPKDNVNNYSNTDSQRNKKRLEIQINNDQLEYLKAVAELHLMTSNAFVVDIIEHYITGHPTLSNNETQALYQSNYQLLRIGRNLNQIARQLNIGESGGITTDEIQKLRTIIEKHTESVNEVIQASRKKFK